MSHKGYTLIEMLVVLLISNILMMGIQVTWLKPKPSIDLFESTLIHAQTMALKNHQTIEVDGTEFDVDASIFFNPLGNIREAMSVKVGEQDLVLWLGPGRMHAQR